MAGNSSPRAAAPPPSASPRDPDPPPLVERGTWPSKPHEAKGRVILHAKMRSVYLGRAFDAVDGCPLDFHYVAVDEDFRPAPSTNPNTAVWSIDGGADGGATSGASFYLALVPDGAVPVKTEAGGPLQTAVVRAYREVVVARARAEGKSLESLAERLTAEDVVAGVDAEHQLLGDDRGEEEHGMAHGEDEAHHGEDLGEGVVLGEENHAVGPHEPLPEVEVVGGDEVLGGELARAGEAAPHHMDDHMHDVDHQEEGLVNVEEISEQEEGSEHGGADVHGAGQTPEETGPVDRDYDEDGILDSSLSDEEEGGQKIEERSPSGVSPAASSAAKNPFTTSNPFERSENPFEVLPEDAGLLEDVGLGGDVHADLDFGLGGDGGSHDGAAVEEGEPPLEQGDDVEHVVEEKSYLSIAGLSSSRGAGLAAASCRAGGGSVVRTVHLQEREHTNNKRGRDGPRESGPPTKLLKSSAAKDSAQQELTPTEQQQQKAALLAQQQQIKAKQTSELKDVIVTNPPLTAADRAARICVSGLSVNRELNKRFCTEMAFKDWVSTYGTVKYIEFCPQNPSRVWVVFDNPNSANWICKPQHDFANAWPWVVNRKADLRAFRVQKDGGGGATTMNNAGNTTSKAGKGTAAGKGAGKGTREVDPGAKGRRPVPELRERGRSSRGPRRERDSSRRRGSDGPRRGNKNSPLRGAGGASSSFPDRNAAMRGPDRGDPRGDPRGDLRGDPRGDHRGDPRGDPRGGKGVTNSSSFPDRRGAAGPDRGRGAGGAHHAPTGHQQHAPAPTGTFGAAMMAARQQRNTTNPYPQLGGASSNAPVPSQGGGHHHAGTVRAGQQHFPHHSGHNESTNRSSGTTNRRPDYRANSHNNSGQHQHQHTGQHTTGPPTGAPPSSGGAPAALGRKLWVGNLPRAWSKQDLENAFKKFGTFEDEGAVAKKNHQPYGFVTFSRLVDAQRVFDRATAGALEVEGVKNIRVEVAGGAEKKGAGKGDQGGEKKGAGKGDAGEKTGENK